MSAVGHLLDVDDLDTPAEPSGRRRTVRRVVVGVTAAAVLAGAVTLGWPSGPSHRPVLAVPPGIAAPHPVAHPHSAPLDTAIPTIGPAVTWQSFQGRVMPYSATAGPSAVRGPVVAGYAHTPTGALIAAVQIGWRFGATPHGGWRAVTAEQVMPGPSRDAYVGQRGAAGDFGPADSLAQTVAFRFDGYTPALAVVDLVTRDTSGNLQSAPSTVTWSGGDWRLVLPADVSVSGASVIPNLDGYVPWSGVS